MTLWLARQEPELDEVIDVYIPALSDPLRGVIRLGSGIVGTTDGERTTIDYEGNLYGAQNIVTWADRVMIAAGRHSTRYPTVARSWVKPEALIRVGTYEYRKSGPAIELEALEYGPEPPGLPLARALVCQWLGVDDASLDAEMRLS